MWDTHRQYDRSLPTRSLTTSDWIDSVGGECVRVGDCEFYGGGAAGVVGLHRASASPAEVEPLGGWRPCRRANVFSVLDGGVGNGRDSPARDVNEHKQAYSSAAAPGWSTKAANVVPSGESARRPTGTTWSRWGVR